MPNLIEIDPAQAVSLARETPQSQGAGAAQALEATGRGAEALGRGVMSYQSSVAQAAARDYRSQLKALRLDVNAQFGNPDERESHFETKRSALRDKVLRSNRLASESRFNQDADIFEEDQRLALREQAHNDRMRISYEAQGRVANDVADEVGDGELGLPESMDRIKDQLADWDRQFEAGLLSTEQRSRLAGSLAKGAVQLRAQVDAEGAEHMLDQLHSYIDPSSQATLRKSLEDEDKLQGGRNTFDAAMDVLGPDATLSQLLTFGRENAPNGAARDDFEGRARRYYTGRQSEIRHGESESDEQLFDATSEFLAENPSVAAREEYRDSVMRDEGSTPAGKKAAVALLDVGEVQTDSFYLGELWANPGLMGQPGYTRQDLLTRLAPEDRRAFVKRHADFKAGTLNSSLVDSVLSENFDRLKIRRKSLQGEYVHRVWSMLRGQTPTRDLVQDAFDRAHDPDGWGGATIEVGDVVDNARNNRPEFLWAAVGQLKSEGREQDPESVAGLITQYERAYQRVSRREGTAAADDWYERFAAATLPTVPELLRGGFTEADLGPKSIQVANRLKTEADERATNAAIDLAAKSLPARLLAGEQTVMGVPVLPDGEFGR